MAAAPCAFGRQAAAVIAQIERDPPGRGPQAQLQTAGLAVAQRVCDALLRRPVQRKRRVADQPRFDQVDLKFDRDRRMALTGAFDQVVQRFFEAEAVEYQRREPRDQTVHRVVQARGLFGDQPRCAFGLRVEAVDTLCDRQRHAANGGDGLAEFVMQLARDHAALVLDVVLDPAPEFAAVGERAFGAYRAVLGFDVRPQRAEHAVEGSADGRGLGAWQSRQRCVEAAGLELAQRSDDSPERPHRAPDDPEHECADGHQQAERSGHEHHEFVPGVERGAARVRAHDQAAVGKIDGLL